MIVCLDELVNIYKLANSQARNSNYEQVLCILNDSLQGISEGIGFLLAGTPEFLMDTRRGLYSYPALQSRLAENTFAKDGLIDLTGPVVRLAGLTPEEFYVLLQKIRHVYAFGEPSKYLLPDEALAAFMEHCQKRIGEAYFRTPRTTIQGHLSIYWPFLNKTLPRPGFNYWDNWSSKRTTNDRLQFLIYRVDQKPVTTNSQNSNSSGNSSASFLLTERIQRWIWQAGWTELRDIEEHSIPLILEGVQDLIIAASTASGKTEVAFFPILTRLVLAE